MKNPIKITTIKTPTIEQLIITAKLFVSSIIGLISTIFIVKFIFKGGLSLKYSDLTINV